LLLPAAAEASNGQDLFIISACYFFVIYLSAISVEQRTHAAQLMTAKISHLLQLLVAIDELFRYWQVIGVYVR